MKLYYVNTIVKTYGSRKNVNFTWFYNEPRTEKRPYDLLVDGYEPGNLYAEYAIDELFTLEEAEQLKSYLDRHHGDEGTNVFHEVPLPLSNNIMGVGAIPVGGGQDFYMLSGEEEYDLPFKVYGYFDLRFHPIDNEAIEAEQAKWLAELERAASDLVEVISKEKSGIRDGNGFWLGSDAVDGTMQEIGDIRRRRPGPGLSYEFSQVSRGSNGQFVGIYADDEIPF